jgi:hypothetical protein
MSWHQGLPSYEPNAQELEILARVRLPRAKVLVGLPYIARRANQK